MNDDHKDELIKSKFDSRGKVDVGRFKGLGEMPPSQLKETTMDPAQRTLLKVVLADTSSKRKSRSTDNLVEKHKGRKPEKRYKIIKKNLIII